MRDPGPNIFIGHWSQRHPLGFCQKSRLWEVKQVFQINHVVCTNRWSTLSYSSINYGITEWPEHSRNPSNQMPFKNQPGKQAFPWIAVWDLMGSLFSAHALRERMAELLHLSLEPWRKPWALGGTQIYGRVLGYIYFEEEGMMVGCERNKSLISGVPSLREKRWGWSLASGEVRCSSPT